MTLKMYP